MNGRQLEYFVRIADLGSFRRASEELRIAQPALTRQILKLEDELGVQLLNRGGRKLVLTSAGATLLDRAKFILRQIEQARADVMAEGTIPSGTVGIGAPTSIAQILFSRLAQRYLHEHPQVMLQFFEGVGSLRKWLQAGEIDLAILPDIGLVPGGNLQFHRFFSEQVYLVGAPGELEMEPGLSSVDVLSRPLILTAPPSSVRGRLDSIASKASGELRVVAEAESNQVQKDLVKARLGYALLPHSAVYADFEEGQLSLARVNDWKLDRILAWRVDRPLTPAAQEMMRIIRIEMERLRGEGAFGPTDLALAAGA